MNVLRSVGARLAFALALVVLLALGIAYAIVVPTLERNLVDSRLDQLTKLASVVLSSPPPIEFTDEPTPGLGEWTQLAAIQTSARVMILSAFAGEVRLLADSGEGIQRPTRDPVALAATKLLSGEYTRGVVDWSGTEYAEVAFGIGEVSFEPFRRSPNAPFATSVALFSSSLEPTLETVELVKRRVLIAGLAALAAALVAGYGGAYLFARRIRRLERAADRIAGGELDEPVEDRGSDELGELARAFERMRGRLAQLEHARREFVANASHELRTPIFSLAGFLELLADEDVDDATRAEFLAAMGDQVDRLTRLAADLLDLSRLDAGRLRVDAEPVDLRRLADALEDEFAPLARSEGHELSVHADGEAVYALADELKVLRIGRVLVENALRHTPPGTPIRIEVSGAAGTPVLRVVDLGSGIASEHLPHVFDRFYRADGGIATGSGLGLAIAQELATVMDGSLAVESRPGRTVFSLALPAAVLPEPDQQPLAAR